MTVEREALADSLLEFVLDDVYYVQKHGRFCTPEISLGRAQS